MTDVFQEPRWQLNDLGRPIPDSAYAVSTCLPTWATTEGYERGEAHVLDAMTGGYPRFVYHRTCQRLFETCRQRLADEGEHVLTLVSRGSAERFRRFLQARGGDCVIHDLQCNGVHAARFPAAHAAVAKQYWQHTGEGTSVRLAEACLDDRAVAPEPDVLERLRQRVAEQMDVASGMVTLYPTGMTGITTVHRVLCRWHPDKPVAQFGFPYVDTLKVLQKFANEARFLQCGDAADLERLEDACRAGSVGAVFTELPSNPLLLTPNLERLRDICRAHDVPVVIDDTIATAVNVNALRFADVVCTSLTKFFSGAGDVAAGAVVVNPESRWADELNDRIAGANDTPLFAEDARVLLANSEDWVQRVHRINANALTLAEHLREHPTVARVHYPKFSTPERYAAARQPDGGYGGLLSIEFHNPTQAAPRFFDAIRCNKGPNLGTNYTLLCPYTILAHFDELDWAASCGVDRWLVRVSVGLEPIDDLIGRFDDALDAAGK